MFVPNQESFVRARPITSVAKEISEPTSRPMEGMLAGTLVETITGWHPVERLFAGDAVYTQDGGLRQVQAIRNLRRGPCQRVMIPGGVLGTDAALTLPVGQLVLVEGPALESLFDLPMALARVGDLAGLSGIRALKLVAQTDLWQLIFDEEELVWTAGALRLHCPARDSTRENFFERLSPTQARLYALAMGGDRTPLAQAA